jgi:putative ABC transport system substrate-binding protein
MLHGGTIAVAFALFASLLVAEAQSTKRAHRIGILSDVSPPRTEQRWLGFFRERGYVKGQNAIFEFRSAEERFERLPALADELVRLKVDIIMTVSTPPAVAAKRVTQTIPIITVSADPVGAGLVASLARPGGNVTGIFLPLVELGAKRLQLLRDAVPELDSVAVVWNPLNEPARGQLRAVANAAQAMGIAARPIELRDQADLDRVFQAISAARVRGLIVVQDPMTLRAAARIGRLAAKHRLPSSHAYREFPHAGGLMSYGPSNDGLWAAAVDYADKILRGTPPGDLPMEQPTRYELVINLKTARALGLQIPRSLLLRADQVIGE